MNCPALDGWEDDCNCSLKERIALQTEQTMVEAWRKRAYASEAELAAKEAECERLKEAVRKLTEEQVYEHCDMTQGISLVFMMRITLLRNAAGLTADDHPLVVEAKQALAALDATASKEA